MKKVNIQFKFSNRFLYTFIVTVIMILVGVTVFAYTGNVGHTSSQIDESDPTVASSVKDGVSWSELSGIPSGFEDGVDNEGISGVSWSQISGIPSGFADGTDNTGMASETDTLQSVTNRGRTTTQNIRSPKLEDNDNTGYYADPNGNSWLYRIYSYDIRSDIFYDRQNTGYYVDPASTSKFNTINLGGVSRSSWPSGVSWNEVSGKPSGFADNVDNEGSGGGSLSFGSSTNVVLGGNDDNWWYCPSGYVVTGLFRHGDGGDNQVQQMRCTKLTVS